MRELLTLVERDFARFAPPVRARWDAFEAELAHEASGVEAAAAAHRDARRAAILTDFMQRAVTTYLSELETLVRETAARA